MGSLGTMMRRRGSALLVALAVTAACGGGPGTPSPDAPAPDPTPPPEPAPWSGSPLRADEVPAVYLEQWRAAENRATCALLAPTGPEREDARPRAAQFGGGWAVAYDLPGQRSAFGVAGTGVTPDASTYDDWPHHITWADGSRVGYGPEGGSGPNQLAYLRVAGEACLYNVWSRLGVAHLEGLLRRLRRVET